MEIQSTIEVGYSALNQCGFYKKTKMWKHMFKLKALHDVSYLTALVNASLWFIGYRGSMFLM